MSFRSALTVTKAIGQRTDENRIGLDWCPSKGEVRHVKESWKGWGRREVGWEKGNKLQRNYQRRGDTLTEMLC